MDGANKPTAGSEHQGIWKICAVSTSQRIVSKKAERHREISQNMNT